MINPVLIEHKSIRAAIFLLGAGLIGNTQAFGIGPTWEAVAPINTPRFQFAAGATDNNIYIFGGNGPNESNLKSLEALDLNDPSTWSNLADNNNNCFGGSTCVDGGGVEEVTGAGLNGKFYVFGGYGGGNPYGVFNFVQEYDPASDTWSSKASMPTVRSAAISVAYENEIYLFGGDYFHPVTNKETNYKIVEAYNPDTDTWRKVPGMTLPQLRQAFSVAVVNDKAYIIGGGLQSTMKANNNVSAYDFKSQIWIKTGLTALPTPRVFTYGHAAPVLNGKIYLIGGAIPTKKPSPHLIGSTKVEIYDPLSNTWQIGPALPQTSLFGAAVVANEAIYVISGTLEDNDTSAVNNVWKLDDAWKSELAVDETCDLNADGKFSSVDATLFTNACKNDTAYWECDLNADGQFTAKDTAAYKLQWKKAKTACPTG
ncbi:MAG: hypothetical protein HOO92_12615 [Methylococcaceae bacterium]|nr:hypothetical protein [Methylococcaceae bacterium]